MKLNDLWNTRYLGAKLGLIAAAATTAFIVVKLVDASKPMPTAVRIVNVSGEPLVLDQLKLGPSAVSVDAVRIPGAASDGRPAEWTSQPVALSPGMRAEVTAKRRGSADLACAAEARPQGSCVVKLVFNGSAAPQCEFECKPGDSP